VANWREELKKYAKEESDRTPAGGGNNIGIRGGEFKFQGADLGDTMNVVIVAHAFRNEYYDTPFDRDNPTPPACFAIAERQDGMAPSDKSPKKQSEVCADCWANEWASAERGKGKACGNRRQLALIHGDDVESDDPTIAGLRLPPTTMANFSQYVKKLSEGMSVPSWAVLTKISFDDDEDHEKLKFELVEPLPEELLGSMLGHHKTGMKMVLEPPDVSGYKDPEKEGTARKKKKTATKASTKKTSKKKKKTAKKKRSAFS
jgi:hypothetical protein